ncbi:putative histidine kinase 2 [Carex rostrata]
MVGSKVLSNLGAEVKIAENGFEALHLMPVMDGYEAARQIRTEGSRYGIHTPIITVSADASDEDVQKAVAAGMDRHLLKPLDKRKVVDFFKSVGS